MTKSQLAAEITALRKRQASLQRRAARAGQLAGALRKSEERYRRAETEATRLAEITATVAASLDPDHVLDLIVQGAVELIRCDFAVISRNDEARGGLTMFRWGATDPSLVSAIEVAAARIVVRPGEGIAGRVFQERQLPGSEQSVREQGAWRVTRELPVGRREVRDLVAACVARCRGAG